MRVRELLLGDGQRATVIMEDGRIKRIVTTNGQVAEVRWQNSAPRPNSNEGRLPLTVNVTGPALRQCVAHDWSLPCAHCCLMCASRLHLSAACCSCLHARDVALP